MQEKQDYIPTYILQKKNNINISDTSPLSFQTLGVKKLVKDIILAHFLSFKM